MGFFRDAIKFYYDTKFGGECEGCINRSTCMCDNCCHHKFMPGKDEHHSDTGVRFEDYCYPDHIINEYYSKFPKYKNAGGKYGNIR